MYIATTVSIKKRAPLKTKMEQKNIALKICTAPEKRKCLKKLLFGFGARSLFRSELLRFEGVFFFFILASISKQHHVQVPVLLAFQYTQSHLTTHFGKKNDCLGYQ